MVIPASSLSRVSTPRPLVMGVLPADSIKSKLANAGQSGLLAYGGNSTYVGSVLSLPMTMVVGINFLYYSTATLLARTVIKIDSVEVLSLSSKLKKAGAHLLKLSTIVWIGSQATKALRISFAFATAPAFERIILSVSERLQKDRAKTFGTLIRAILTATVLFYLIIFASIVCSV